MPAHPHTGPGVEGGGWPMNATAQPWHAEGRPLPTGALRGPTEPCVMAASKAGPVEEDDQSGSVSVAPHVDAGASARTLNSPAPNSRNFPFP